MRRRTTFGTVAVALCLSGCAGGGGGGSPATGAVTPTTTPPVTPPPTPPVAGADTFRTAEYFRMGTQLDQVRAADAYALGYTGQGVKI